jgi:hypothetical protein
MSGLMSRNMAPSLSQMSTSTRACHWLTSSELERISFLVKSKVETNSDNTIHSRDWTSSSYPCSRAINGPQILDVLLTASHPNRRAASGVVENNASLSMMGGRERGNCAQKTCRKTGHASLADFC